MKLKLLDIAVFAIYFLFLGLGLLVAPRNMLSAAALCLSVACSVLWFVARWQLGDAFSVAPQARHLVTRGLYSKIRHPIYLFGTLAFLFVVLALQGWAALIIWAVVILIQVLRIRPRRTRLSGHVWRRVRGVPETDVVLSHGLAHPAI